MDTEYQISSSKLENLPIIDNQCCVNLTTPKIDNSVENSENLCSHGNPIKRSIIIYIVELFFTISILCFSGFIIYMTVTSGYFQKVPQTSPTKHHQHPPIIVPLSSSESNNSDPLNLHKYIHSDRLRELSPRLRSIILRLDQSRLKRDVDMTPCHQNMEHCANVIDSMWSIVSIVNNSMPHLRSFLKNGSTSSAATKSKFVELVECLQCKNDSIAFIDESGPENLANDHRMMYEQSDRAQIKNNVDIVTNLLNNEGQDVGKHNWSTTLVSEEMTGSSTDSSEGVVQTTTTSIFDGDRKEGSRSTSKELQSRSSTIRSTEYESVTTEVEMINATTSASTRTEERTSGINGIDTMQTMVTMNVTDAPDGANVTEIVNAAVHPSGQGHGEQRLAEREGENGINPLDFRHTQGRIVSNAHMGATGGTSPTAETMKSTQQLQLTPTMSWMPYQVCFYGPQANGQGRQTAPGPIMYPTTAPGPPYPPSMQQHRPGFQNSNQAPSFVQVQANSVQFLPMPPFQGNNWQQGNQRVGPTGPGVQNFPMFPGHQIGPSGGANNGGNNKSPYYCTYIPAPTFQFPAIPGVSEYQRSRDTFRKEERIESVRRENSTNDQRGPVSQYVNMCSPNMIRCADGTRCILRSQWCNGQVDCNDASDETTCSCRDRISQERLCDGYFDCPHGEDELGCLGCPKTSFSCNDWQRRYTTENCVPLSQRCDGVEQCANGKDEMDCNILTPSYIEGKNVFTIGYTEGYLHKNFKGQWYPVCTAIDSWAKDACISEVGPEINAMPEIKIHSVPDNAYEGPYLAEVGGHMELVPSCMNTAIYVRCPRFPCGTRILSRADSLRPNILDNESLDSLRSFDEILWRFFGNRLASLSKNDTNVADLEEMVSSQMRVVGGRASQPKAWPFLVAIYKDGLFYCGGVILNELWVLTAAHCLEGYMGHYYEVHAGMLRRLSFSPMRQFRKARYSVIHPRYSSVDMSNDIGMIMLDDPLRFNRWVRPACLPGPDILGSMWRNKPEPNTNCVAIGWGSTKERGPDPDHMREVELPILANCKHEIDQHEATICAGYPQGGRDACQGDSGGPLMCRNPYSESQWYVAGIVSHGEGCARPNEPGTYTRVSYFLNWIQEISSGRGVSPLRRTPLETCPGFSCEGGLGKCLPIGARCNKIIDCLDGEDEVNCRGHYPAYRNTDDPDSEVISSFEIDNSTMLDKVVSTDSTLIYQTNDEFFSEEERNNEVESDEDLTTSTTYSPNYTERDSEAPLAPIVFPTVFTCTRLIQNIPVRKRCDRVVDCEDSTDEMDCTCKDYLTNTRPNAICDGYTDCDDLTDEQDCEICAEHEFFCRRSKVCISMSKRCDAKFDCEFREDELDCYALTDGQHVYLDADKKPYLNTQGILTRYTDGKWQPTCHNARIHQNQSTATLIGQNMCEYFGFAKLQSSESVTVNDFVLETIPWNKNESTPESDSSAASLDEEKETCQGLYIRCTPILSGNVYTYYRDQAEQWPWLAAIYVDGEFRCTALLLDRDWLLTAAKCLENVRLDRNYTAADMGYDITLRHIEGPHRQTYMIDEMHFVNNSVSVLLHLKNSVTFSRQVRPLFLDRRIYLPGMQDTCEAIGTNSNETRSVFVRPILQSCPSCQRCFVSVSSDDCSGSETLEWSGTIFCRGKTGWYPAVVFQDNKGLCSFKNSQTLTSIDYINPYLTEVTDDPRQSTIFEESTCDGFRCKNGQCVPKSRVCDGVPDCRDRADEDPENCKEFRENCENSTDDCGCKRAELRCRNENCVDKSAFCDGNADCPDGSDEPVVCTCAEYLKLTAPERLCDGVRHCLDKTDESPEMCLCRDTTFRCETKMGNDVCIPQDFICDGDKDCPDGEDEARCRMLKPFSENSDASGEVITRSYGVWHSECFSTPLSSEEDASDLCKSMGYSSGNINNDTIIDEPVISRLDEFYIVKINSWTWMSLRNDKPLVTLEKSNETCYRALVDCF